MKRFFQIICCALFTSVSVFAQDGINYQGAATDANGDELTNQTISLRASIISGSANGNLEWEETHSTTTDQFGLFNVVIGQGNATTNGATANFDDMDWGSGNHFLKIEMDAAGGTNYAMIGTTQMMSVPYALYAKSAGIDSTMLANMIGPSIDSATVAGMIDNADNVYLECVDMGVSQMCPGLGLDPNYPLQSNNGYNYDISTDVNLNSNNYIAIPHWRKFKISGLNDLISGGQLMFKHKSQYIDHSNNSSIDYTATHFLTPEINNNGDVYFYLYEVQSNSSCGNSTNILLSIPSNHSWMVHYATYGKQYKNNFEIYYQTYTGYKPTGIVFDR